MCFVAGPGSSQTLVLDLAASWARAAGREVTLVEGSVAVVAAGSPGVRAAGPDADFPDPEPLCWHLGGMDPAALDDLAAVGRVPGGRLPGHGRPGRLLWILDGTDLDRWGHLLRMGRLASCLRPAGVTLLVDGVASTPSVEEARTRLRCRAEKAVGTSVEVKVLPTMALPGARAAAMDALPPWWGALGGEC